MDTVDGAGLDEAVKRHVSKEAKRSTRLKTLLDRAVRPYERYAIGAAVVVSSILPMKLSLKLYYAVSLLLARNPKHRYAVETMEVLEGYSRDQGRS